MFVIRNKNTGHYLKGGRSNRYYSRLSWVEDINNARTYGRKCDASNSITGHFRNKYYTRRELPISANDVEVLQVKVSISTSDTNMVPISPEIIDRATRFMMKEEAEKNGAPKQLIDSFEFLDTNDVVRIVTTLYKRK